MRAPRVGTSARCPGLWAEWPSKVWSGDPLGRERFGSFSPSHLTAVINGDLSCGVLAMQLGCGSLRFLPPFVVRGKEIEPGEGTVMEGHTASTNKLPRFIYV